MVRYSEELIDEIRNNNDIVDVVSQYVTLKRSGRNFFGLCPFHKEKSPSFSVSPDKQIFHCFGCGIGGNVFHFISKIENLNFRESVEVLAEKSNISLPTLDNDTDSKTQKLKARIYELNKDAAQFYHENLYNNTSKLAQEYVKRRKLDNTTLKKFIIGYSGKFDELYKFLRGKEYTDEEVLASSLVNKTEKGKFIDRFRNRLMFPIQDNRGRIIAFGGRVLDDSKPKYINSPENIVYSKGRNLYGLYNAKKHNLKKIIIVEGYMDAISLAQRGVTNVVASLGTALTENQGRLLRQTAEQVIIGYDSDGAGQTATLRGLEILSNLGCDVRILQLEGAKDPDEFITKYGSGKFNIFVEKAISLVEFKVKILKTELNIENTNDKIKFLNEIAKILSKVDNNIEKEVYLDKISKEYKISKESIYSEINKIIYPNTQGKKILEKRTQRYNIIKKEDNKISDVVLKRENTIISLLIMKNSNIYEKIKNKILSEDFKYDINKKIVKKLYEEYEKENNNIYDIVSLFDDEETISHLTSIMAEDYEIVEVEKGIEDILNIYEKEKMIEKRNNILMDLDNKDLTKDKIANLEKELSEIIIKLASMK